MVSISSSKQLIRHTFKSFPLIIYGLTCKAAKGSFFQSLYFHTSPGSNFIVPRNTKEMKTGNITRQQYCLHVLSGRECLKTKHSCYWNKKTLALAYQHGLSTTLQKKMCMLPHTKLVTTLSQSLAKT